MKQNIFVTLLFVFFIAGCVTYVSPVEENPVGKKYTESINIRNMEIPLPEGEWEVIGRGYRYDHNYFEIVLFNIDNENTVYIKRNSLNNSYTGYKQNSYLKREDLHHSVVKNNYGGEAHDGWLINHYRLSLNPKSSQAMKESYEFIVNNNYTIPGNYIQMFHHFTGSKMRRSKMLEYSHFLNPETEGFDAPANADWVSSDWHPLKINSSPKKVAFINKLKKEGEIMHAELKKAFGD